MANEQKQHKLQSTPDGKGGVYISWVNTSGYLKVYYCKDGSQKEILFA